ncbi:LysM domain superfamily [Fusarium oxysporum f. sp. vasinfectum]|nr:LysM domain superfamily [Fusarium oxysporum f. sp. vasinfectum]
MHLSYLLVQGLLAVSAGASRHRKVRRQKGPTDPGIPSDCTYWETVEAEDQGCTYLEDLWELEHATFVEYNPSVKDDCSGIQLGHSYCVEVNNGFPRDDDPPKVTSTKDTKPEPEPTRDTKPSPTQDGLIDTCTSGIWASTWYCVGVPGTPISPPTKTIVTTTKPTGVPKPTQTQEGLIKSCTAFHMAKKGDTYAKIISKFGTFDFDTFYKWNPAASYYYYVAVPGTTTIKPSTTTPKPMATRGIKTPSPIQEGLVKNCNKFHQIASTTTCSSIESYYKLPLSQFLA